MKRRILSASLAVLLFGHAVALDNVDLRAADYYDTAVTIQLDSYRKAISPYIYGVNSDFRTEEYLYAASAPGSARQGGNRFSGYNWETNFSNAGADYYHNSDQYLVDFDKELLAIPGGPALEFAREAADKNVPYKVTTIQMAGYVAADDDGEVTEDQIAPSSRWIEVKPTKGSPFSLTPDTTDGYVYMDEYVNYLVQNLGDATNKTGYQAYNLDNEPALWGSTHAHMHPAQPTCEEIISKSITYASAIKAVDPHADIFGLALYGIGAYTTFRDAPDWSEHAASYDWFISYYLDEIRKAEEDAGQKLIDVIDLHYYSEAKGQCRVTECSDPIHTDCNEARVQATRTLWDNNYIENSWVGNSLQAYIPILPKVNRSIAAYNPDTKIAMTEYNFGGGFHVSGAVAEADALGIFAEQGVYVANLYKINDDISYQLAAIDLYTNYDGAGSAFGDTLIASTTSDDMKATSYAAIDGTDESKVTLVLTNKSLTETQHAAITLAGSADYTTAKAYAITGDSSDIQLLESGIAVADNTFSLEVPALSVVMVEITADDAAMMGDVNMDGVVDVQDIQALQSHLLVESDAAISAAQSDLSADSSLNAFDLAILKKRIGTWNTVPVTENLAGFWPTKDGQWRIKNGMSDQTLTCVFTGDPGNGLRLAYGYWDTAAVNPETGSTGMWFNNDDTYLGTHTFDADGKAYVTFTVPANCSSLELILFNYTTVDASGNTVQLDKTAVGLEKILIAE